MIKKTVTKKPPRGVIYGTAGVGKSTLLSHAPGAVFICCEDGARMLDVPTWVFDEKSERVQPETLAEFRGAVKQIAASHDGYQNLVIDGVADLDKLVQKQLCAQNPKWNGNFAHEGYGRPETMAFQLWRELIVDLESANNCGLGIWLVGHAKIEKHMPPDGPQIDRYQLSVQSHKLGDVAGMLFGWADLVGFCRFQVMTVEEGKRTRGIGVQGARIMHLNRTDSWDAKSRYKNSPDQIPVSWSELDRLISETGGSVDVLRSQIEALCSQLPAELQAATRKWLAGTLTVDDLTLGLDRIKANLIIAA